MSRARLIYDGECGFCTWSAAKARRWVRVDADVVAWQSAPLREWGLTPQECADAVQWVGSRHERRSGARAVAAALQSGAQPWRFIGSVLDTPAMRGPAQRVYQWVAKHRHRLPGATAACAVTDVAPSR